jgi:hypothetical protein
MNGTLKFMYNRIGEYDTEHNLVEKWGRFVDSTTGKMVEGEENHFQPYRRYASSMEQFKTYLESLGDVSVCIEDDIWIVVTPKSPVF